MCAYIFARTERNFPVDNGILICCMYVSCVRMCEREKERVCARVRESERGRLSRVRVLDG